MRVSNNKARDYVNGLKTFQGSNTFAEWRTHGSGDDSGLHEHKKIYVVYSYGSHFPMYVYDDQENKWIGNKDKYSQSTTRHQSLLRPSGVEIMWLNTNDMQGVINNYGIVGYLINKAQN
jgi:hypothetical protein